MSWVTNTFSVLVSAVFAKLLTWGLNYVLKVNIVAIVCHSFLMLCMISQFSGTKKSFAKTWPDFHVVPPTAPFFQRNPYDYYILRVAAQEWIEIVRSVQNRHDSALTRWCRAADESMNLSSHLFLCTFLFGLNFVTQAKKKLWWITASTQNTNFLLFITFKR